MKELKLAFLKHLQKKEEESHKTPFKPVNAKILTV